MELRGSSVFQGIVIGEVMRYEPFRPKLTDNHVMTMDAKEALVHYEQAKTRAREELDALENRIRTGAPDKAKIISAQRDILMDSSMDEIIRTMVISDGVSPDTAIARAYDSYAAILKQSRNKLMRERSSDLLDVKSRLLRCWAGEPERDLSALPRPVIVVADDLFPSDTAGLDCAHVLGIITQMGGGTCHTAIIARSYGIPAIMGVAGAMEHLANGQRVILDAVEGIILTDPSAEEEIAFLAKKEKTAARLREDEACLDAEPMTRDGVRLEIHLNVAAVSEPELSGAIHADGCGLFRTEFLYTNGDRLPDEEEQYQAYKKVLAAFGTKPVIMRTMDIGGDKQLPGLKLPKESNPFLGVRGLRLSLDRPELFRTQVRAALRASAHGNLKVMMPMVGGLDEVRAAKAIFAEEGKTLDTEGVQWNHDIEIGIMVEVPSIALIADMIVDEVDFISVGTNDLVQYLCAADRMNPAVRPYYQDFHPAVFRMLDDLCRPFADSGKSVSVCGELGGNPLAIPVLAGMGIRKLSMAITSIAGAKRVIRELDMEEAKKLAREVRDMKTAEEIRGRLAAFERHAQEGRRRYV